MKTVLSMRYLEPLTGKLVALLLNLPFKLIKIDGLGFLYRILKQNSQVDLLEDNRILSKLLCYEFIPLF